MPIGNAAKILISIVGPTAVGKTAMSIKLAQHLNTEIISADSRQFFREMSIGTAKPSEEELSGAPHHFINSHSIEDFFSTGDFEIQALEKISEILVHHDAVIMVGGSGLYVNAVCNGLDSLPDIDLDIRNHLNQKFIHEGIEPLKQELLKLDPEYFEKVDQSNTQRIIRGLEFVRSTGKKLSSFHTNTRKSRPFDIVKIGLNMPRERLYDQINNRVDLMITAGLLEEVKNLIPYRDLNALKTVGYSELFDYLEGTKTLKEATDLIKQNTRRFAKRQLTWFRKDEEIKWFEPDQLADMIAYVDQSMVTPAP